MMYNFHKKIEVVPGSSAVEQATVNRLAGGSNPSRGASFLSWGKRIRALNLAYGVNAVLARTACKREMHFWEINHCFHLFFFRFLDNNSRLALVSKR